MVLVINSDYITEGNACVAPAVARAIEVLTLRDETSCVMFLTQIVAPIVRHKLGAVTLPGQHPSDSDIYDNLLNKYNNLQSVVVEVGNLNGEFPHDFTQVKMDRCSVHLNGEWLLAAHKAQNDTKCFKMHLTLLVIRLIREYANLFADHVATYVNKLRNKSLSILESTFNFGESAEKLLVGHYVAFMTSKSYIFTPTDLIFTRTSEKYLFRKSDDLTDWMDTVTSAPLTRGTVLTVVFHPNLNHLNIMETEEDSAETPVPRTKKRPRVNRITFSSKADATKYAEMLAAQAAPTAAKKLKTEHAVQDAVAADDVNYAWLHIPHAPSRPGWKS